ncbi:hypothetical protein [Actinoplanes aureus]|uniref:Uncharacterized protein n=1 Tax=Actinoplanes aureus TaxID=2792083 RepID=A0A931CIZ2_9ACTN|nr:hypothetical protein [Actinoplanes aureus]MBG0567281.1 hypothetical protein [Actinoplanes aureus]
MSSNNVTVRQAAMDAPLLLLAYGVLRLADGFDGDRGPGLAWNLGHLAFFAAMVLFGVLAASLVALAPAGARRVASVAAAVTVFGVACFLWVITGDLSPGFRQAMPLPAALEAAGPMAFTLGMLTLLGLLVAARAVPVRSPLLFGAGIVAVTVHLDLLPLAALLLLAALAPLARGAGRTARREPVAAPSAPLRSRALH